MEFFTNTHNLILLVLMLLSGASLLSPYIPGIIQGNTALSPALATALINRSKAVILDIRSQEQFNTGHLARSKNLPADQLLNELSNLRIDKSTPILLICETGTKAGGFVSKVKAEGYAEVLTLQGGINAWNQAGLPLVNS